MGGKNSEYCLMSSGYIVEKQDRYMGLKGETCNSGRVAGDLCM